VADELPELLLAYREFEPWIECGPQPEATPNILASDLTFRSWRDLERWYENPTTAKRNSSFPIAPLRELLEERREPVQVDGVLGDWQAITIQFSGEVLPRKRADAFKSAMFAAYPSDLVFSKIDARNGAIGLIPDSIPKAVVTSEHPVFTPKAGRLRAAYLHYLLRAEHFKVDLQRKASGTSGRKRVTLGTFLALRFRFPRLMNKTS
jgi:hypothetical protein